MKKTLPVIIIGLVALLLLALGVVVWQKSQGTPAAETGPKKAKKVDLATQPKWVQDLVVTVTKGQGSRLPTLTFKISGIPADMVTGLNYTAYFETSNRGTQGSQNTKDTVDIRGKTDYSHTFDLGTCSSGTCLAYQGVKSIDLELEFIGKNDEEYSWSKTLELK